MKKAKKNKKKSSWAKSLILKILKYSLICFFGSSIFFTIFYRFVPPPVTPLMIIRKFEKHEGNKKTGIEKDWKKLEDISPNLVKAVVASEDNKFMHHFGFDFEAIKKVSENNKKGKHIKGASTISQQTAKNVFLWPNRSWVRKGFEAYFTFLIEVFWSKKRIMEVYLNVIEMGDGIYGAEAASMHYFGKPASRLNAREAAAIASVLPNPRRWNPARPTPYILRNINWTLGQMDKTGNINFK